MADGRFAVAGAGISGLAAAWELERHGADVVVLDPVDEIGGKLRQSILPGLDLVVEEGADAFLARVPDALELCAEIGIDDLVHPATSDAYVYANGALRSLPAGHVLGLPTDLEAAAAAGLLSPAGVERARADLASDAPPLEHDVAVGELLRSRLGDEVCDHLVGPLLGGINAGEVDRMSTEAVAPQLWALARAGGSLIEAAIRQRATAAASDAPVFATPAEGVAELPRRVAELLTAEIRLGRPVPPVTTGAGGVHLGDERFDGIVVATPAHAATTLLADAAPGAAALLGSIEHSSVVLVTLAVERAAVDHTLDGSGFVVARTEPIDVTAVSWGSSKWQRWDDGTHAVFRISLGHDADPTDWCAMDDADLVAVARRDLRSTMGIDVEPVSVRVGRWPRSFPQYRPGHLAVAESIDAAAAAAGPIAVAGMGMRGVGIPACIREARRAARTLLG